MPEHQRRAADFYWQRFLNAMARGDSRAADKAMIDMANTTFF